MLLQLDFNLLPYLSLFFIAGRCRWTRVSFQAQDSAACPHTSQPDAHACPEEPSLGEYKHKSRPKLDRERETESTLCRMPEFTAQSEFVGNSWQSVGKLYFSLLRSHIDCIVQQQQQQLSRTCSGSIVDNCYSKCNMQQTNRGNYVDYDSMPWLAFCK